MQHRLTARLFGSRSLALFALVASTPSARADVLIVDASGGGDFTELQAAVNASADGDTLLVRAGTYDAFTLDARALDVVADEQAVVTVMGTVYLRNLAASQEVVLSGLTLADGGFFGSAGCLNILDCAGQVRVVDTTVTGADGGSSGFDVGAAACIVRRSSEVALFHCQLRGGRPGVDLCSNARGGAGLLVEQATVELFGVSAHGGRLESHPLPLGGDGGHGVVLGQSSVVRASGGAFAGGAGGDGDVGFTNCVCGDGGSGLIVATTATALLRGTTTAGGAAGAPSIFSSCSPGAAQQGTVTTSTAPLRGITLDRIARFGGPIQGMVRGEVGDLVLLLISTNAAQLYYPGYGGSIHVGAPYYSRGLALGTIGASGALSFQGGVVGFPLGLQEEHLYVQPLHFSNTGGRWLGDPDVVMLLASGL
jgi:hypothetical protein